MYAQISSFCLMALIGSISAAPVTSTATQSINVALHPDTDCSILASGYPGTLNNTVCYTPPGKIGSLEFYTEPSTDGLVTVFTGTDCTGSNSTFSPEQLGCITVPVPGGSVMYTVSSPGGYA